MNRFNSRETYYFVIYSFEIILQIDVFKAYFCFFLSGLLLVKLFQYYKSSFVKFLYEDNPKPWHECQVLLRPIAHTFATNQIRSDNRKVTNHDIKDNFKSIFIDFISNNASGRLKLNENI